MRVTPGTAHHGTRRRKPRKVAGSTRTHRRADAACTPGDAKPCFYGRAAAWSHHDSFAIQLNCSCLCSSSMIRFDLSMIMRDVHHQRHGVPPPFACPCCPHGRMFIQIPSPGDSLACTIALDCARPSSRGSNTTTWPCRRKGDDAPTATQSFLLAREAAALCCTHHQANTALACYWFLSHPSRSAL